MKHTALHRYLLAALCTGSSLCARQFENQTFALNTGALFNFARYDLGELPKIEGYLAGIHTDLTHSKPSKWFTSLIFDGRWNAGYVSGNDDIKVQIKDYRPELQLGYTFFLENQRTSVTPFTGLGFFYLSNEIKPDIITYRYFNLYVPVGLHVDHTLKEEICDIGLLLEYRPDVWTRLKVNTPCVKLCEKFTMHRAHGLRIELPFTHYHTTSHRANIQTKIVPFFDWNHFGAVNQTNCAGQCIPVPKLNQWYLGLHVDIGLRF